jgi:hypothetical protein
VKGVIPVKISDRLFVIILSILLLIVLFELVLPWKSHAGEIHGEFEVGYVPEIEGWMTSIELNYFPWTFLRIRGGVEVLMDAGGLGYSGISFQPYRDTYSIGVALNLTKNVFVEMDHSCTHPVYSNYKQFYDKFEGGNRTTYTIGIQW